MRDKEKIYMKYKKQNNIILKQKAYHEYKKSQGEVDKRVRFFQRNTTTTCQVTLTTFL